MTTRLMTALCLLCLTSLVIAQEQTTATSQERSSGSEKKIQDMKQAESGKTESKTESNNIIDFCRTHTC